MTQRQSLDPKLLNLAVAGSFSVLVAVAVLVNIVPSLDASGQWFRPGSVPTALLDSGKLGHLLKYQGLVHVEDNDGQRYPLTYDDQGQSGDDAGNPFRRKRKPGPYLYRANGAGKKQLPSTVQSRPGLIPDSVPLLSVAISARSLNDPVHGLIANSDRNNRETEKPGTLSFFVDSALQAAGGVGVRLYGSRFERSAAASTDVPDLELFLRKSYGLGSVPSDAVFGESEMAVTRDLTGLVVERGDVISRELALSLADLAGLTVPLHRPGFFQLNGRAPMLLLLREPVSGKQWRKVTAAADLDFIESGGDEADPGWRWRQEMNAWFGRMLPNVSMKSVNSYIDMEDLTDTLAFMMFCGSSDWSKWAIYRDRSAHPLWKWITWDLQTCFQDRWKTGAGNPASQHWIEVVATRSSDSRQLQATFGDLRAKLFAELMNQDQDYPAFFYGRMQMLLEQLESSADIDERISSLSSLVERAPMSSAKRAELQKTIADVARFIPARIAYIRSAMRADCLARLGPDC